MKDSGLFYIYLPDLPLMKSIVNYLLVSCLPLTAVLFSACGPDLKIEHGTEFHLALPDGTDGTTTAKAVTILENRLAAFGLDQDDFDVISDAGMIKVRVSGREIKNVAALRRLLQSTAHLTFRSMYDLTEISEEINQLNNMLTEYPMGDSTRLASSGLWRYCRIAYDVSQQSTGMPMPIIFYVLPQDTAAMNAILRRDSVASLFPSDLVFMWGNGMIDPSGEKYLSLLACKTGRNYEVSGTHVANAEVQEDDMSGSPVISITFDATGTTEWSRLTKSCIGQCIAIEVDGYVYSFPTVQGEITGGKAQISGPEPDDVTNLSDLLKSGSLPVPLKIVSEENF